MLGLLQQTFEEEVVIDDELQALIDERQEARKTKNFARADEIRDELKARGLMLKDTPAGRADHQGLDLRKNSEGKVSYGI